MLRHTIEGPNTHNITLNWENWPESSRYYGLPRLFSLPEPEPENVVLGVP
jgi:hypothetical protein